MRCTHCGEDDPAAAAFLERHRVPMRRCSLCRESDPGGDEALAVFVCVDCPRLYTLDRRERDMHLGLFGCVPRRCPRCRASRRTMHEKSRGQAIRA